MKKHTFPGEQEEIPLRPDRPEIIQPTDPKEPEIPERQIEEMPTELPPDPKQPNERPPEP